MVDLALIQIPEFYDQLKCGNYPRIPQDKTAGNTWRKRSIKDGLIDFRLSTKQICNLSESINETLCWRSYSNVREKTTM